MCLKSNADKRMCFSSGGLSSSTGHSGYLSSAENRGMCR